jgi:transcriptional regulator with XRE-family HTH domain
MSTQHDILMQDPEFRKLFAIECLAGNASEVVAGLMAQQQVTKAELARRLNKTPSWITQLLSGRANMTVRTLAEVAHTLGAEIKLTANPTVSVSPKPSRGRLRRQKQNG